MLSKNMFEKDAGRRKIYDCTWTTSNLQPYNLRLNAYRSLPGGQDVFSLLISSACIHRNPGK